jgi:hypothetical protein
MVHFRYISIYTLYKSDKNDNGKIIARTMMIRAKLMIMLAVIIGDDTIRKSRHSYPLFSSAS